MSFKLLGGGSDINTVINDVNQNILELKGREVTEIFKDDTGTRRVILDKDGLRTSPAGVDVTTATNAQLTFNSNQNVFKIVTDAVVTLTKAINTSFNFVNVTHGLGYSPTVIAYADDGSNLNVLPVSVLETSGGVAGLTSLMFMFTVDSTKIQFQVWAPNYVGNSSYAAAISYPIHYYIVQETANTT